MIFNKNIAQQTALYLLQINAIKLNPENPFTWASGWKSPIYCDNRIALSYPTVRTYIREQFAKQIEAIYRQARRDCRRGNWCHWDWGFGCRRTQLTFCLHPSKAQRTRTKKSD